MNIHKGAILLLCITAVHSVPISTVPPGNDQSIGPSDTNTDVIVSSPEDINPPAHIEVKIKEDNDSLSVNKAVDITDVAVHDIGRLENTNNVEIYTGSYISDIIQTAFEVLVKFDFTNLFSDSNMQLLSPLVAKLVEYTLGRMVARSVLLPILAQMTVALMKGQTR